MDEQGRVMDDHLEPEPAGGGRSVWQNLGDVIVAPSATFDDVRERPRWFMPLLVVMAATLVISYLLLPLTLEVERARMVDQGMTPEQVESAMGMVRIFGAVIPPIAVAIFTALFALLFWGWAAVSGAREPTYKAAFTAMVYTGVIQLLQAIAQVVVVFVKGADAVAREGGPPTFGLGLFLEPEGMPKLVYGLLANVNFFAIWSAIVMAIAGVHALRMGKGAAWGFAIFLWLLGAVFLAFGSGA